MVTARPFSPGQRVRLAPEHVANLKRMGLHFARFDEGEFVVGSVFRSDIVRIGREGGEAWRMLHVLNLQPA